MTYSTTEMIKEIRTAARNVGLTFKKMESLTINNSPAYKFVVRGGGEMVLGNCTLSSAYENVCSGYISSWNGERFTQSQEECYC